MQRTFLMAGGGTGGHVIPALAVARELRARGHTVRFVGTQRGLEATLVPQEGFPIDWIQISGLKRVGLGKTLTALAELPVSIWEASRAIDRAKPAAVFSMGGYVAGPVLLAALWKSVPVVIMEPNVVPGFTHRRLARFVTRALVSFQETARWFPEGRTEVTGLPVREEFFTVPERVPGKTLTILITGGSQGSRTLNRAAEESWPLWKTSLGGMGTVQFIHQTGASAYPALVAGFREAGMQGEISAFVSDMPAAFAQADLVVSRSGMGTISELAAAGKPSILVPFPGSSDQHQLLNARAFEKAGAARVVLDSEMTGARLVEEMTALWRLPGWLERTGRAARGLARAGAAKRAAEILEAVAHPR